MRKKSVTYENNDSYKQRLVKSVQSALSDLLTTSVTHGTNTNARESFEHC